MNDFECAAYAYSLQGLSNRVILKRLMEEVGATHEQAQKALTNLQNINRAAPPVPRVQCYWEELPGGKIQWWQDNWFGDQWDEISKEEFEIRRALALKLYHTVEEGMPE